MKRVLAHAFVSVEKRKADEVADKEEGRGDGARRFDHDGKTLKETEGFHLRV